MYLSSKQYKHSNNNIGLISRIGKTLLLAGFVCVTLFIASCGANGAYNPTTYKYYLDKEALSKTPLKRLILAEVNASGLPTRSYLRDGSAKMAGMTKSYLKSNGYTIVPYYHFENAWNKAILTYGEFYDPTTGRVNQRGWQQVMASTLEQLRKRGDIDGVVFADIIEHEIQHSPSQQHYARWYGVTRKPSTQGTGSGVPVDFNWTQSIKGASLVVTVYDINGKPLFSSRGGLETLQAVDLRNSNGGFVRRKSLLKNTSQMEEGMEIAFHPFIPMKKYPGRPEQKKAK